VPDINGRAAKPARESETKEHGILRRTYTIRGYKGLSAGEKEEKQKVGVN